MWSLDPFRTLYMLAPDDGGGAGGGDGDGAGDGAGDGDGDGAGGDGDSLLGGKTGDGDGAGDGDGKDGDGDGGAGKPTGSTGAPESYEAFKVPAGMEISDEQLQAAIPVFKEAGLSQEAAQKVIDLQVKNVEAQQQAWAETSKEWQQELKGDADIGGAAFTGNVEKVRSFVDRVAGDDAKDLKDFFNRTGYGNFPPLFRFILKLAGAVSEDSFPGKKLQRTLTPEEAEEEKLRKRFPKMAAAEDAAQAG